MEDVGWRRVQRRGDRWRRVGAVTPVARRARVRQDAPAVGPIGPGRRRGRPRRGVAWSAWRPRLLLRGWGATANPESVRVPPPDPDDDIPTARRAPAPRALQGPRAPRVGEKAGDAGVDALGQGVAIGAGGKPPALGRMGP